MGQLPAKTTVAIADKVSNKETEQEAATDKVVLLAAGDGGIKALSQILVGLPSNFSAAIIVVQHIDTQSESSLMAEAISRSSTLPMKLALEGERLQSGMVYIAPPNQHLLVTLNGTICLSEAALVDFVRPSADLLFQSAAASFKQKAIAVVLSGRGKDGTLGVRAIHQMGGKVIAADESSSDFFEMPGAAIATGTVNFVLPVNEIASTLLNLVMAEATE
ncbi:chemotaxis protein CheB [Tolypothrix bouteillei VB521301]|uniref:protein-glutamate methylesterase n=3 Tax=Nostocales TaxID=1161 RepID=A0A8S9TEF6_9CYAN|nr:chemotaxis protein CheB [Tolypothrix bouteillei VB521301]